jgi:hypothetical protein
MKIRSTATLGLVVLGLVASACTIQAGQQTSTSSPATGAAFSGGGTPAADEPVAQVVSATLPAVVNVTTDILTPQGQTGQGVGTGFIVRSDGRHEDHRVDLREEPAALRRAGDRR